MFQLRNVEAECIMYSREPMGDTIPSAAPLVYLEELLLEMDKTYSETVIALGGVHLKNRFLNSMWTCK